MKRMLTRQEVAQAMRVTPRWVSENISCGYTIGRRRLYAEAEVASIMESMRCHTNSSRQERGAGRRSVFAGRRTASILTEALELATAR